MTQVTTAIPGDDIYRRCLACGATVYWVHGLDGRWRLHSKDDPDMLHRFTCGGKTPPPPGPRRKRKRVSVTT